MKPQPRLTPEQEAERRAEYERAYRFELDDYTDAERRAARGFLIGYVILSAAIVCISIAVAFGGLL